MLLAAVIPEHLHPLRSPAIPLSSRMEDQHTRTQRMLHAQHGPSTTSCLFSFEKAIGPGLFSTRPLR